MQAAPRLRSTLPTDLFTQSFVIEKANLCVRSVFSPPSTGWWWEGFRLWNAEESQKRTTDKGVKCSLIAANCTVGPIYTWYNLEWKFKNDQTKLNYVTLSIYDLNKYCLIGELYHIDTILPDRLKENDQNQRKRDILIISRQYGPSSKNIGSYISHNATNEIF